MKKRNLTLLTASAAAVALASSAQAAPIVTPQDGYDGPYRLAFVTNGVYGAKSQVIDDYNTFVTSEAAAVTELAALDTTWKVIGSTGTVSAKVNTGTYTTADGADYNAATDVPIYTTTGLRVALNNDDLWDGSIENPIWYGDGTENNPGLGNAGPEQIWTGTESDGSSRPVGGDGSYLGASLGGDGTADYITLARGGYTDGNWIEGPSSHDGTPDNNRTYTKHFMALSGVINGVPAERSQLQVARQGENLVISWESALGKLYNLRSETNPAAADPSDWPIFEGNMDLVATPPTNTLTFPLPGDPSRYFVVEEFPAPPVSVFSDDFESGQGDWVTGNSGVPLPDPPGGVSSPTATVWELGTPDPLLLGGPPAANSGTNCFGTDLDTSYADETGISLRSPSIDLTTAGGATLTFWRFYDIETSFDWGRVRVLDAADDSEIAVLEETIEGTTNDWEEVSIKLPAEVAGKMVKIEFILATDDFNANPQAGLYLDDVSVTVP